MSTACRVSFVTLVMNHTSHHIFFCHLTELFCFLPFIKSFIPWISFRSVDGLSRSAGCENDDNKLKLAND